MESIIAKKHCAESDCGEDDCGEGNKTLAGPGPLYHCGEKNCAEEEVRQSDSLSIEESGGEEEDIAVTLFITQMAYALLEGRVTPTDIYEGMVLANCGDKNVARHIRDRAVAEAALYRVEEEEEKKQEREALSTPKVLH